MPPVDFRHSFPGHEAHSAEWAGLKGKKNGELLQAAEGAGYQVLLTVDQVIEALEFLQPGQSVLIPFSD